MSAKEVKVKEDEPQIARSGRGIEWLSLCEACGMLVVPSKHSHAPADVVDRGA